MSYATKADMLEIYSSSVIDRVAYNPDLDPPGTDNAMITRALQSASDEIDTHLSARYTLPLPTNPPMVKQLCIDIAVYRMALTADKMTTEIGERYKYSCDLLKRIADGKAGLGIRRADGAVDPPPGSVTDSAATWGIERG